MDQLYKQTVENGRVVFHKNYRLFRHHFVTAFDAGCVRLIAIDPADLPVVSVLFADGSRAQWSSKWIVAAYLNQFGVAVSSDGKYVFAQTWERGLFCLDARSGELIWRSKSKRGITSLFVNDSTILCHRREQALQLLDIHTGEVLQEKRPATAWGFTAIDHRHIVCQVTARRWEILQAETLETKAAFSHREFTNGHEYFCVNDIHLEGNLLTVRGFMNVWDDSVKPPKFLPNLEFAHCIEIELDP